MNALPVAETFFSIQGEGLFTGTQMLFIRLAGCTVGKPFTEQEKSEFGILNNYQTKCTAWNDKEFACDTNYKAYLQLTAKEIAMMAESKNVRRVCLTGGEPLMHKDTPDVIRYLIASGIKVHLETSGTIPLASVFNPNKVWITVSPKKDFIKEQINSYANEIKILVDGTLDEDKFAMLIGNTLAKVPIVWIQPINGEHSLDMHNVDVCLNLIDKYPNVRMSIQTHKVLNVR